VKHNRERLGPSRSEADFKYIRLRAARVNDYDASGVGGGCGCGGGTVTVVRRWQFARANILGQTIGREMCELVYYYDRSTTVRPLRERCCLGIYTLHSRSAETFCYLKKQKKTPNLNRIIDTGEIPFISRYKIKPNYGRAFEYPKVLFVIRTTRTLDEPM